MTFLHSDLRFQAPDDIYEAVLSLGEGLNDTAAHSALAAFAWLMANHVGDDVIVLEAIAQVKQAFKDFPEAAMVGTGHQQGKAYHVGGALDSLRKIIEIKPVATLPGALTS
ncbi:MAG: DUF2783 domain-containing protein [Xanthobacteraceae bacterium]